MKSWIRVFAAATALATLAACGGGGGGAKKSPPERLALQLKNFSVNLATSSLTAERIRVVAFNSGTVQHKVVVLRTDLAPDALPVTGDVVDEKGAGLTLVGSIDPIEPGKTERKVFTVTAGKYVLICNIPTHYQQGMRAALTIT